MWRSLKQVLFIAAVLGCFGQSVCSGGLFDTSSKFVIVKNEKPNATIVIGEKASENEKFVANELQNYIRKISGAVLIIKRDYDRLSGNLIAIGRNKVNEKALPGVDTLDREGFRIKTDGSILTLAGKDDAGTQFAVYTFLEKYLGVRWFWPGELGEVVPQMRNIEVGKIDDTEQPDFKWRNRGPGGALWGAKTGPTEMHARELVLGITSEHQKEVQLWEKRNKWGGMKIYGGHALGEIFPPERYGSTHPEYYAMINGKRAVPDEDYDYKHEGQVCTGNPEVVKITVEWVRNFFEEHPDYDGVHITMNDGGGFCECEKCRALDSGEVIKRAGIDAEEMKKRPGKYSVISDRIFTFVNQVAEEVQKTHPGKYVVSMAYSRYITPPKNIKLNPFVIPQYCLWSAYKHSNAELKKEHEEIAAGWAKASKKAAIYEYYINGSWPGLHRLFVPYLADSIRYLHKQGIDLFQTQAGDEFGINGINYYVAGKLLWDTSLDEKKILDDFYQKAFGRAGESVRKFHNRLGDLWKSATEEGGDVSCNSIRDTRLPDVYTQPILQACKDDLDAADIAADNDLIRKRIEFYRKGLRYTELTVAGTKSAKKIVDIVQASRKLKSLGINLFLVSDAAKNEDTKNLMAEAVAAWQERDGLVEELKNDYVLAYFWVRYNEISREDFYPYENLKELSKILNPK